MNDDTEPTTAADLDWLARQFEANRARLTAVAYRMLGSTAEADDAVQESWIRLSRTDTSAIENLSAWLTTVTARVCLNILRSRTTRREDSLDAGPGEPAIVADDGDPERDAVLADSVGLALLVVLQHLPPAERVAFVLHDMFAVPFDEIAPIVGRTPTATRKLASRARDRVQGAQPASEADQERRRAVVEAFLAASRGGDMTALLTVLDPDVVLRTDVPLEPGGEPEHLFGAGDVATRIRTRARSLHLATVDGVVDIVAAPAERALAVFRFTIVNDRIIAIDLATDPAAVAEHEVALLD